MLHPWDHAAGNLICQQAGGASRMLDGAPYNAALTQGHLLTASCEETWSALAALIRPTLE
jgi:fructose-1,6-bisphosphatase/inositol monophosphatase family enzyme